MSYKYPTHTVDRSQLAKQKIPLSEKMQKRRKTESETITTTNQYKKRYSSKDQPSQRVNKGLDKSL